MRDKNMMLMGGMLVFAAAAVNAQTAIDRSFTTTSNDCGSVQWSDRALATYPTIASACQAVEQRNGKTYVKFEGKVKRVSNGGQQLVVNFKDGGEMALSPPPETKLYIDGRATPVAKLQPGDQLKFYVAEDRLAAQFPETEVATTRYDVVPFAAAPERAAEPERMAASLPSTASDLPFVAYGGLAFLSIATLLGLRRRQK